MKSRDKSRAKCSLRQLIFFFATNFSPQFLVYELYFTLHMRKSKICTCDKQFKFCQKLMKVILVVKYKMNKK